MQISKARDMKGQMKLLNPGQEIEPKNKPVLTNQEFMEYYERAGSRGNMLAGKTRHCHLYGELRPTADGLIEVYGRGKHELLAVVRPEEIEWIKEAKTRKK